MKILVQQLALMINDECIGCGKCCTKHWLVRLTNQHEKDMFGDDVVDGGFIWTDTCKFHINKKCTIHEDKPYKCKEYFCEGNLK